MKNKLDLIGSGNQDGRFFYIFSKDSSFFSLFPKFLMGCGFENLGAYEDYSSDFPDLDLLENKIEYFKNDAYDIDIIFTRNRIILIVRTSEHNRDNLVKGIKNVFLN